MNRRELVAELAERTDSDKRTADAALQAFIDAVTDTVAKGDPVAISGFCKFVRRDVPAKPRRMGRNPATGEEMMLAPKPASKSVRITPLKAFKDAVISGRPKKKAAKKSTAKRAPAKKAATKRAPAKKATRRR
jgi:nucleoid DNA-binding protein